MKIAVLVLLCCVTTRAQENCFRTVREAATQAGVRDGEGFRLEGIRMDRVQGGQWARVLSCLHPERPAVLVKLLHELSVSTPGVAVAPAAGSVLPVVVTAGSLVRIVRLESMARLEMMGVAQGDGARGDKVRVRLGAAGEEHFAQAVVRDVGLVELEAAQ